MERVITYIDGFNLYFGLKTKGWKRYYWLDLQKLTMNLLKVNQKLIRQNILHPGFQGHPIKPKDREHFLRPWRLWITFIFFTVIILPTQ